MESRWRRRCALLHWFVMCIATYWYCGNFHALRLWTRSLAPLWCSSWRTSNSNDPSVVFSDEFWSSISARFQSFAINWMEANNLRPLLATGSGRAWRWHPTDSEPSLIFNWSRLFCTGGTLKACFVLIYLYTWVGSYVASSLQQDELLSKELLQFQSYCKYCTIFATEVQGPHR